MVPSEPVGREHPLWYSALRVMCEAQGIIQTSWVTRRSASHTIAGFFGTIVNDHSRNLHGDDFRSWFRRASVAPCVSHQYQ